MTRAAVFIWLTLAVSLSGCSTQTGSVVFYFSLESNKEEKYAALTDFFGSNGLGCVEISSQPRTFRCVAPEVGPAFNFVTFGDEEDEGYIRIFYEDTFIAFFDEPGYSDEFIADVEGLISVLQAFEVERVEFTNFPNAGNRNVSVLSFDEFDAQVLRN